MKHILLCDYPQAIDESYEWQKGRIEQALPDAVVRIVPYTSPQQFQSELADADALLTAFLPLTREVLAGARKLRIISYHSTGYGTVNLAAAKELGITVTHVVDYCTTEVAEHTMALMFALARHLKAYDHHVQERLAWNFDDEAGMHRLAGRQLILFGWGRISRQVARYAKAFGLAVGVVSQHLSDAEALGAGVRCISKEEALAQGDILSNHMAESQRNYHYFDRAAFAAMERAPLFLNVGRGSAVDEAALAWALDEGRVSAAGLDVLQTEAPDLAKSPFLHRPNVILTPHAAFYSEESIHELAKRSSQNIIDFFTGHPIVNLAE